MYVCLFDKQGRARAVTLAFPSRYLLATPHKFLDQLDGFVCLWLQTGQGRGRVGQGRAGQGRVARADTHPLDLLAIYRILGENRGTCI